MFYKNYKVFKYFIIIPFFIILLFSCAIYDWAQTLNEEGNLNPEWDLDFDVNILNKNISIEDYIEDFSIDTFDAEVPNLAQWPIAGIDMYPILSEDIDISAVNQYDFDNDSTIDFIVKGIRSSTVTFELIVWLTETGQATILPLSSTDYIDLNSLTIEGVDYTFNPPTIDAQGRIIYTPNNFLSPALDYYLNFGNDPVNNIDQLNVTNVDVRLVSIPILDTPEYPVIVFPGYTLHVQANFNLGTDFGVVGEITNNPPIQGLDEVQDIPLIDENSSYENVNELIYKFTFENNTPFIITIQEILSSTTVPPVPDTYTTQILSGNLVQHSNFAGYNNYWYVTGTRVSTGKIVMQNLTQFDDLTMDMLFNLEIYSDGRNVLFTPNRSSIRAKLNVEGEVTVGL